MEPALLAIWIGALGSAILALTDLRWRRIPNVIVYPLLVLVPVLIVWRWLDGGSIGIVVDLVLGFLVIGGMWLAVFIMGGCGGGDVKLMAANAGLLGLVAGIYHMAFSLSAAVLYLIMLVIFRRVDSTFPGTWLSAVVAGHTVPVSTSGPKGGRRKPSLAIPFALPVALGYMPLLIDPVRQVVLPWL